MYYTWKGDQYALACDRWDTVTDNLQACNKTIEAIRGIDRWGTGDMIRAAFQGFKELPAPVDSTVESCWDVLGIPETKDADAIYAAFRKRAKESHSDVGGTDEEMIRLNAAKTQALNHADH